MANRNAPLLMIHLFLANGDRRVTFNRGHVQQTGRGIWTPSVTYEPSPEALASIAGYVASHLDDWAVTPFSDGWTAEHRALNDRPED